MLPPPAGSRQNSYAYSIPRPSRSRAPSSIQISAPHSRLPSSTTNNPWAILPGTPGTASPTRLISGHGPSGSGSNGFPWRRSREQEAYEGGEDEGDDEDEELRREMDQVDLDEDERGLEETLEKLGMGAYHWRLLALCGFGWMSDNSALQCIGKSIPPCWWSPMEEPFWKLRLCSCNPTESASPL